MLNNPSLNRIFIHFTNYLLLFLVIVTICSIFIGIHLVFFTQLKNDSSWYDNIHLDFLLFDLMNLQFIQFNLGISFLFFWLIYLMTYVYCFFRPFSMITLFKETMIISKSKIVKIRSNYLLIPIYWFSGYFVISIIIDMVQQSFGVNIGSPLTNNAIFSFFYLTAAPLNEEIFFRVILLGIPLYLIFMHFSKKTFFSFLFHPYNFINNIPNSKNVIYSIIFINSIFFGLSHYIFGGGYEIGKITQAAVGGIFLGWLYYRHGLPTSIIFHWLSNYVPFAYGILGFVLFGTSWNTDSDNILMIISSISFILLGIIFLMEFSTKSLPLIKGRIK